MLKLAPALMLISGTEEPLVPVSRADETRQTRETKALQLEKPRRAFLEKTLYEIRERQILEQFQESEIVGVEDERLNRSKWTSAIQVYREYRIRVPHV